MKMQAMGTVVLVSLAVGGCNDKATAEQAAAAAAASAAAASAAAAAAAPPGKQPITATAPGQPGTPAGATNTTVTSLDGTKRVNAGTDGGAAALNLKDGKNTGAVTTDGKGGVQITGKDGKTLVLPSSGGLPTSK